MTNQSTPDVSQMAGRGTQIEYKEGPKDPTGRINYRYSGGCIHAHKVPDGYEIAGFGEGFFGIRPE